MNKSLIETAKFVLRTALLVGVPAVLTQLAKDRPEWGAWIGIALLVLDKLIHENKDISARGLLPF